LGLKSEASDSSTRRSAKDRKNKNGLNYIAPFAKGLILEQKSKTLMTTFGKMTSEEQQDLV